MPPSNFVFKLIWNVFYKEKYKNYWTNIKLEAKRLFNEVKIKEQIKVVPPFFRLRIYRRIELNITRTKGF